MAKKNTTQDLLWAEEVMDVYRALGSLPGSRTLATPSANHLLAWAQRAENETKFLADLVPKATAILAKHKPVELSEAAAEIDRKTIAELKICLQEALADAESGVDKQSPKAEAVEQTTTLEYNEEESLSQLLGE